MQQAYTFKTFRKSFAILLLLGVVSWSLGLPSFIGITHAENLTFVSDLLSDSGESIVSNHTISFTVPNEIPATTGTIVLTFPDGFNLTAIDYQDFDITDDTVDLDINGAAPSGTEWGVAAPVGQVVTLTNGSVAIAAGSEIEIEIGLHASHGGAGTAQIVNTTAGSYVLNVETGADSSDTRIVILPHVSVTAAVDTIFTFTVTGIDQGEEINGDATTTAYTTTATSLPFGTLVPGSEYLLGQQLTVATNAKNGYIVTVHADGRLVSGSGASISTFDNDSQEDPPIAWATPDNDIDDSLTWGHEGITTEDISLTGAVDFNSAVGGITGDPYYSGAFLSPLEVMMHSGPSNGTTPDKGLTKVGFRIEITAMQPAANDYTQSFHYVATPTF